MATFWRILLLVILIGAFIYLGGGRVIAQAGKGLVSAGESMERAENIAKDRMLGFVDYITSLGQERIEKNLRQKEREREIRRQTESGGIR